MERRMEKLYVVDLYAAANAAAKCGETPCSNCLADLRRVIGRIDEAIDQKMKEGTCAK